MLAAQYVESGFGLYSNLIPTFCGTVDFLILKSNNLFTDLIFSVKFTQIPNRSFYAKELSYYCELDRQIFLPHQYIFAGILNTFCFGKSSDTITKWLAQCTEVRFASFLFDGFTNMAVINPPEWRLAKRTSVKCLGKIWYKFSVKYYHD